MSCGYGLILMCDITQGWIHLGLSCLADERVKIDVKQDNSCKFCFSGGGMDQRKHSAVFNTVSHSIA